MGQPLVKRTLYSLLDRAYLGRGVPRTINGETIRFPARWARYYPDSYQQATYHALVTHCAPGTIAIDVGAHIGLFSIMMARRVGASGAVLSFEPTQDSFTALESTVRHNHRQDVVRCHQLAVAAASGPVEFFVASSPISNANSMTRLEGFRSVRATAVRLDDLDLDRRVSFIKIDAEGAELDVLEGSLNVVREHRPVITLDIHPASVTRSHRSLHELGRAIEELKLTPYHDGHRVSLDWVATQGGLYDLQLMPG